MVIIMDSIHILHLSDLHFGIRSADYSKDLKLRHENAIDGLFATLRTLPKEYPGWCPNIIAITGDIAWEATESNYDEAAVFIKELLTIFHLSPENLVLCPGNHDVDRDFNSSLYPIQSQSDSDKYLALEKVNRRSGPFENFAKFSRNLGVPPLKNSVDTDEIISYLYGYRDIQGIRFYVFNTAWNVRNDEKQSLWIGTSLTLDMYHSKCQDNDLSVSIFHHPFDKLHDSECHLYNQEYVVKNQILEISDVILNGHVHGEIHEADFLSGCAHVFTCSAAFDKDSARKGCQIIRIDRSQRLYSTKVIRFTDRHKWKIEDLENEVPLDKGAALSPAPPSVKAVPLFPETIGWWLDPDWDPLGPTALPIDDSASICLLTFLLARTDPYVVVLASDAQIMLTEFLQTESLRLEKHVLTADDVIRVPRTWSEVHKGSSFAGLAGIVVTLSTNESECLSQAMAGHWELRERAPNAAIVYCIWSDSLKTAAGAAQQFAKGLREQSLSVDVLALSVGQDIVPYQAQLAEEAAKRIRKLNRRPSVSCTQEMDELLGIRDQEPELWPYVLRHHATTRDGKYRILSFAAACHTKTHMKQWFQSITPAWFQEQENELNPYADLICQDESRRLVWGIYQQICSAENEEQRQLWQGILEAQLAAAPSVMALLSFLEGQSLETDALCPEDVSRWARTASQEEFQRFLPALSKRPPVYWAALLASPYGLPYVLKEFSASSNMQLVLNAAGSEVEDPHLRELLVALRQISHPYQR